MKKQLFLLCLVALSVWLASCGSNSAQNAGADSSVRSFVMTASWRPGGVQAVPRAEAAPRKNQIQFGRAFEAQAAAGEKVDAVSAACLECHYKSYAELAKRTANYVNEWGSKGNPHVYVDISKMNPHKADKVVPSCLSCHTVHAQPRPAEEWMAIKPKLTYCYGQTCHHNETFESCSTCH
jgi:predicted small secreted protein